MPTLLRKQKLLILALVLSMTLVYYAGQYQYQISNTFSYATRPLWDREDSPKLVIPHYYSEGMKFDESSCKLHGWSAREPGDTTVFDAVLMSSELDLLEIRMNELDSIVDKFFIIESNATFTGLPKEAYFASNRARFSKFDHKTVYRFLPGYPLQKNENAWVKEARTRDAMTELIRSHIKYDASSSKTLVIMSDVDEIPAIHTLSLLKRCDFGSSIHLQLREFVYSFEWYLGMISWRSSVHVWSVNSYYRHSKSGEHIIADAGWHCSFCFRTIPEYVIKMRGFSHADRIGGQTDLLQPSRIQEVICNGKNIFGTLPEAYNYIDLLSQLSLKPLKSAVGLPRYLIENADRFRFLLPGGCVR